MLGIEAAAVEQQRRGAAPEAAALDFADEDHVVALRVAAAVEALEGRRRAVQQRGAADAENELAVSPSTVASWARAVTMVTPVANMPSAARNCCEEKLGGWA